MAITSLSVIAVFRKAGGGSALPAPIPLGGGVGHLLAMRLKSADPDRFLRTGQSQG